jgi:hypothetical protein
MASDIQIKLARYNDMNHYEKNLFWLDMVNKEYDMITEDVKIMFAHVSHCVKLYINSNHFEKETLWYLYHPLCRAFADRDKYEREKLETT